MAEEQVTIPKMTKYEEINERINGLANRVELLEIIAKSQPATQPESRPESMKKVIQINARGKTYFCATNQEQQIFTQNNPGVETETFNIELTSDVADRYLNDPENKKQFTKRD